jgi:hypothetical protein
MTRRAGLGVPPVALGEQVLRPVSLFRRRPPILRLVVARRVTGLLVVAAATRILRPTAVDRHAPAIPLVLV